MIRAIMPRDLEKIREMQDGFEWNFGPDFMEGLVFVDENDMPVAFAGAWQRAETHMLLDRSWGTPGARYLAMKQIHDAMNYSLKRQGVGQVVTWFDDAKCRFVKRLQVLGWVQGSKTSLHRRVD